MSYKYLVEILKKFLCSCFNFHILNFLFSVCFLELLLILWLLEFSVSLFRYLVSRHFLLFRALSLFSQSSFYCLIEPLLFTLEVFLECPVSPGWVPFWKSDVQKAAWMCGCVGCPWGCPGRPQVPQEHPRVARAGRWGGTGLGLCWLSPVLPFLHLLAPFVRATVSLFFTNPILHKQVCYGQRGLVFSVFRSQSPCVCLTKPCWHLPSSLLSSPVLFLKKIYIFLFISEGGREW